MYLQNINKIKNYVLRYFLYNLEIQKNSTQKMTGGLPDLKMKASSKHFFLY